MESVDASGRTIEEAVEKALAQLGLERAQVWYVHRGAKDDTMIVDGSEIAELRSSFFTVGESDIPYHRVFKITFDGKTFL